MTRLLPALLVAALTAPLPARGDDRALNLPIGDPARKDREVSLVLDGITDTSRGDVLTPAALAERLDPVELLFVGESHTDMDFHRAQLRVIQELVRRGRRVLVGLEMYPALPAEQEWLDRWRSDRSLSEEAFVQDSHWYRSWGYHWNYYREIFRFARDHDVALFGVNLPRSAVQTIRMKGFEGLPPDQRALLPERVDTQSEEHRRLFRAFFGDEDSLHGHMSDAMFEGMYRAQCSWDAAMGWNAVRALKAHGGAKAIMVVLIGAGHVAYGLGAERQAGLWFSGRTASVIPIPIADEDHVDPVTKVQASYADFVWGLPAATDPIYPSAGISTPEQKSGERFKIIMVADPSPARSAGLAVGDELVSIDGVPYDDKEVVNRLMSEKRWGDAVVYKVMRGGQEQSVTVYLRRHAPNPNPNPNPKPEPGPGGGR